MRLIVNVDRKWGIGRHGGMLFHIPEDLKFFRQMTTGGAVIMGRQTLESLPGGRPLKDRMNIVLTREGSIAEEDNLRVCQSIGEALDAVSGFPSDKVYVIGGEQIYEQMTGQCDEAFVTVVDADGGADRFMHDLDSDASWTLAECLGRGETDQLKYEFRRYVRNAQS